MDIIDILFFIPCFFSEGRIQEREVGDILRRRHIKVGDFYEKGSNKGRRHPSTK